MSELKTCRDANHEGENPLTEFAFYPTQPAYCKDCVVRRVQETRKRQRDGIDLHESYLDRHEQRREEEAAIEESLMREKQGSSIWDGEMSFSDIQYNSLDPKPVYRDQINSLLRQQQRTFSWKIGFQGR